VTVTGGRVPAALVRLRPVRMGDLPLLVRWYSDPDVRHWLHLSEMPLPTVESERRRQQEHSSDSTRASFIIETADGLPIGSAGLQGIDPVHSRCELGISIGEKDYWSRGFGTDAIRELLRYAFAELDLRRVELITDIDNPRAVRCYGKCGFVQEGVLRAYRLRYGQPLDMIIMSVLREDWEAATGGEHAV
jgi:RimJ/RimL family protein N-acetyltransferase